MAEASRVMEPTTARFVTRSRRRALPSQRWSFSLPRRSLQLLPLLMAGATIMASGFGSNVFVWSRGLGGSSRSSSAVSSSSRPLGARSSLCKSPVLTESGSLTAAALCGDRRALMESLANKMLGRRSGRVQVKSAERSAEGFYTVEWRSSADESEGFRSVDVQPLKPQVLPADVLLQGQAEGLMVAAAYRGDMSEAPPPPPPRPPRERKQTEVEKQADAIVHAVVAVELLQYHGKLGGTLETAFRKCVYEPALPRLRRLTGRKRSSDDFRIEGGIKRSRPSRIHDQVLEKQFTLGDVFTTEALETLDRGCKEIWFNKAQMQSRREFVLAGTMPDEDPAAKDLVSWSQGHAQLKNEEVQVNSRAVGHNDAKFNIWILPVFVDHDRSNHAERQAMLVLLEALPLDPDEGVVHDVTGSMRVYATHTPCISCLSCMCQFTRAFPGATLSCAFDIWKETKRWIGDGPRKPVGMDDD
eukprot:TRINITY_DN74815_c0_g1_i1.p1 TRINITY_DN74815_c0_g1~~TRINITY_DN74815_c0_g1_i1.p1  ORF type:complete len:471 (-),score=108.28 TRINITY_DN74815_c0_g1_i1:120-1532(-)